MSEIYDELFDDYEKFVGYFATNDSEELRDRLLKTDKLRYWYCRGVRDHNEIWKQIAEGKWAYWYCRFVEDRKEVWGKIIEDEWAFEYCKDVEDREEIWSKITASEWADWYCRVVKDRPKVRRFIKEVDGAG